MTKLEKQKIVVLLGPTATGKTDLGIWLAKKYNGEIVSADSRLVYKEMNIGTAKPRNESIGIYSVNGVMHHMINVSSLKNVYNAAIYKKKAIKKIKEIGRQGKIVFLVGGTGLYIDAVVKNIDFPEIKPDEKLRKELEEKSLDDLLALYKKLDTLGAEKIDKMNKRRLIRAIEVCKLTGKPFWENRRQDEPIFDCLELGLSVGQSILASRITKRINGMIKAGLESEAIGLIKKYGNIPPLQTIGYQEWMDYTDRKIEKKELKEIKERISLNTIKFSKRQMTWFKKNKKIQWVSTKKEANIAVREFLKKRAD